VAQDAGARHVIACDKREAFAQGSASDEAIHLAAKMDCFASLAMTNKFPFFVLLRDTP
jgi:hypothetical protein